MTTNIPDLNEPPTNAVDEPDVCTPSTDRRILLVGDYPVQAHPQPLSQRRDEFTVDWIYRCPPVVTANQMGYVIPTPFALRARWDGRDGLDALYVRAEGNHPRFHVSSHFGMGIITVQVGMTFRTPPGIGLLVKAPPNVWKPDVSWLEGFVETDVLRRDFTFNIKVTRANVQLRWEKGEPIGCVLPYPRDLLGAFDFELPTAEQSQQNERVEAEFARSRAADMNRGNTPSQLYRKGVGPTGEEQRRPVLRVRRPETYGGTR